MRYVDIPEKVTYCKYHPEIVEDYHTGCPKCDADVANDIKRRKQICRGAGHTLVNGHCAVCCLGNVDKD